MTAQLVENMPLLAGAPNGIQRLRELILELAARGKLVPQDPRDAPARELLRDISKERSKLMAEGKIRKQKAQAEINDEGKPYELPAGWQWTRLAEVGHDWGQKTPNRDFTYIDVGSIDNAAGVIKDPQILTAKSAPSRARKLVRRGTVIYSTIRPYLLNVAVIDQDYAQEPIASTAFAVVHPYLAMPSRYFFWYLRSPVFVRYVESVQMGIAYPAINDGQFFSGLIPLPPLAEQHRIVDKVDELMALCDRLEARQEGAESVHAQLVRALLDSLTQAVDAEDFAASWQRLAEHFHTLFTTESSVDALKQAVLQLAVMGKLVPQDQGDEPASELLERISQRKAQLVAEGKVRKQTALPEVETNEWPYVLPSSWRWVRFGSISETRLGKMLDSAKNKGTLRPYLRNTNVQWFTFELDDLKKMRFEDQERHEYRVSPGDLVICEGGEPGRCAVWQSDVEEMFIQKALHRARPWLGVSPFFIQFCLKVGAQSGLLDRYFTGATIKHLSGEKLARYPIQLPPVAEQHRIVAKVNQLMALCDQLNARLSQARQMQEHLANALVEQAVA
ncbi:restriction endonuclease subunit S [Agrilutibacter solisilvae]|uniref:Restriction endonuclease subunit S n=1 Tax=Agrilutibacter solisilvae TaxID=2763317 RepID=A0A975ASK7_9GAMM|nr:restriction endonuclease subunit S [Lysobacter solisilvae]QSX78070.1 restriction endonuclease subunit S [Lysobacter solisilvae]